jgi:hypothetical protein
MVDARFMLGLRVNEREQVAVIYKEENKLIQE